MLYNSLSTLLVNKRPSFPTRFCYVHIASFVKCRWKFDDILRTYEYSLYEVSHPRISTLRRRSSRCSICIFIWEARKIGTFVKRAVRQPCHVGEECGGWISSPTFHQALPLRIPFSAVGSHCQTTSSDKPFLFRSVILSALLLPRHGNNGKRKEE